VAVRIISPQPASWLEIVRRHPSLSFYALDTNVSTLVDTGESRWTVYTDANGFRIPHLPIERQGAAPALALGDSLTFGYGVNYEDCFVNQLEANGGSYHFTNAGVGGYGPVQYRKFLEYLLETGLAPKLVIVTTAMCNDFHDCVFDKDKLPVQGRVLGNYGDIWSMLKLHTHLYRLLSRVWHTSGLGQRRQTQVPPDSNPYKEGDWSKSLLAPGLAIYRDEFRRILEICKKHSIDLFVCIIPTDDAVVAAQGGKPRDPGDGLTSYDLPARKAREIFKDLGIPFTDTTQELAKYDINKTYFLSDRVHLTPFGNKIVAECIRTHCMTTVPNRGSTRIEAETTGRRPSNSP
jgi:lysophospholipase L1-like esterase